MVAKKKMMKKYGWYKHSEDGGILNAYPFQPFMLKNNSKIVRTSAWFFVSTLNGYIGYNLFTESDSDSEFEAFLDDDNGCCASIQ